MSDGRILDGLEAAINSGLALMGEWCSDGTLIDVAEVQRRRGAAITEIERDSLVVVTYAGAQWFLACAVDLRAADVTRVNRAMAGCQPMEMAIFWRRGHGGLRGLTPYQALQAGRLERVVEIAQAWAAERVTAGTQPKTAL